MGPRLVEEIERLHWPGVRTLSCGLLTPELADPVAKAAKVVFLDAALDAPHQVRWRKLAPAASSQIMTHAADPRTVLALARDLFGHAPESWWLTIPVAQMTVGEELSEVAKRGMRKALEQLRRRVGT